ncbi:CLUMA_CG015276, isoform A [Clunio marinus]|uniref:CLUMA_CG015276, isoform A n=1 Tax=Clunio marinus TaxID=568069 RepID=A0A1J1IQI9_9DIPT|nr:CLUMA_CG015276, isoform A [Clunio marinus]
MFGDENYKPLLLPILYDLANLMREGFLKSDKYQENEKGNHHQFLRRSFNNENSRVTKETDFSSPSNFMRVDTLHVEEDDKPVVKNIHEDFQSIKPEPLMMILNSSLNNTYDAHSGDKSLPHKLPRVDSTASNTFRSREEIENLALSDLNGTVHMTLRDVNGSDIFPSALIGRRHKKPSGHNVGPNPENCERFTGGICLVAQNYPTNEIMGSIRRHRHAMEALLAEYRDKTAELEKLDYLGNPTSDLSDLRRQDSSGTSAPGSMCSSIIRYARPQKARSATGEWKFIVNTGEHTQTLRLEKCSQPLDPCSYLTENFESSCTQIYNYHRLLSWDSSRGLHVDIFKVPTCCSCHLVGYKESFPPLSSPSNSISSISSKRQRPIDLDTFSSSSNRNSQYSTLLESDDIEDNNDSEDSNIAYQFGNGFKRLKPKKPSVLPPDPDNAKSSRPSNKRNRVRPETFLTPPANNKNSNFPFTKRNSNRQRTPTLKRKQFDQSFAESDTKVSRASIGGSKGVTSLPSRPFSQSERPKKITPSISSTIDTNSVNLRLANANSLEPKRINYNYHPIIDFFEDDQPHKNSLEKKTGKFVTDDNSWRPVIGG